MTLSELRKYIKHYLESFDDPTDAACDRGDEAVSVIRDVKRYAIELNLPRVAEVCQSVTTPMLALPVARIVLCECLAMLPAEDHTTGGVLTVKQAAEWLNVAPNTVYGLVERGELPHHRIGRAIRILSADIDTYQRQGAETARPRPPAGKYHFDL